MGDFGKFLRLKVNLLLPYDLVILIYIDAKLVHKSFIFIEKFKSSRIIYILYVSYYWIVKALVVLIMFRFVIIPEIF